MSLSLDQAKNTDCFRRAAKIMGMNVDKVYNIHVKIVDIRQAKNAEAHASESAAALSLGVRQPRSRIENVDIYIVQNVVAQEVMCEALRLLACYMSGRRQKCRREYGERAVTMLSIITQINHPRTPAILEFLRETEEYFQVGTTPLPSSTSSTECHAAT